MLYKNVKKHQNTFAKPNGVNSGGEKIRYSGIICLFTPLPATLRKPYPGISPKLGEKIRNFLLFGRK